MTGGIAALVGATLLGARHGRFDKGAEADFEGQSSIFQTLGTLILWFGWYGFNGVSTLAISGLAGVAAKTMVTTTISAAAACVSTVAIGKIRYGYVDAGLANNGILAGLVAITAGCSVVEPEGAFIIGIFAGPTYFFSSRALKALHIDDVVDAAPVHLFCGAWGVLAAGLFATEGNYAAAYYGDRASECHGLFYGGGLSQFGANVVFVLSVIAWVTAGSLAMFLPMKLCGCLRVSAAVELLGIDAHKHTAMNPGDMDSEAFETAVEMAVEMALEKSPRLSNSLRQRPSVTETEMTTVNGGATAVNGVATAV
jgi:Amt family ammonium transporter